MANEGVLSFERRTKPISSPFQIREKNLGMGEIFPIYISSDDESSLISPSSGFACKSFKKEKNSPNSDVPLIRRARVVGGTMSPSPAIASLSKRRRVTTTKEEANENKAPITFNEIIPQRTLLLLLPQWPLGMSVKYKTRSYLAGKKVILYGLPGFTPKPYTSRGTIEECTRRNGIWNAFRLESIMKPVYEFIGKLDKLIGQEDVNEALLLTMHIQVLICGMKEEILSGKFDRIKLVNDFDHYASPPRSLYSALGLQMDIPVDGNIPYRTRRFLLLIDDLRVKYAKVESSDGHFVLPTEEEILKAFRQ